MEIGITADFKIFSLRGIILRKTFVRCGLIISVIFLLSGCHSILRSIYLGDRVNILSLKTNKIISLPIKTAGPPPTIIKTPQDSKYIYSLYGMVDYIQFEKIDLNGVVVENHHIPYFNTYYGMDPTEAHLSPDETKLMYFRSGNKGLYLYDFKTKSEVYICRFDVENEYSIGSLFWLNDTSFIAILEDDRSEEDGIVSILKINVLDKEIDSRLELNGFDDLIGGRYSVKNNLLAIGSALQGGSIKIVDLQKMTIIDETPYSNKVFYAIAWNLEANKLLYDTGEELVLYDLRLKMTTTILKHPSNNGVTFFLAYPTEQSLLIRREKSDRRSGQVIIRSINIQTKEEKKITLPDYWGALRLLNDGMTIAYVAM